ncbi:hypothetical protein [Paenibacillus xanthanilyticus]|uniref:Uncharacterized protein n=1 Tax=Paenibacillus xanthanilyticus TaxID=1783531 RepID=A0ABV8K3N5_9BACL
MSHYAEVLKEQRAIDALLADGYRITRISEDMDGSAVSFAKAAPSDERAELQLLTADARKYVVTLLFARMRAGESASAPGSPNRSYLGKAEAGTGQANSGEPAGSSA